MAADRPARDIVDGVRWLARDRFLRNLTANGAVANLALTGYGALTILFLVRDVGVGTGTVGLLLASSGLGGVAAATATPRLTRRFGAARVLVATKVAAGLSSLLIPLTTRGPGLVFFIVGTAAVAAFVVAGNVIAGSFRQAYVPAARFGRVLAGMQFVNFGTIPLGAVLGGATATIVGTRAAIGVMTVAYALSGLILLLGPFRGRRDLPVGAETVAKRSAAAEDIDPKRAPAG